MRIVGGKDYYDSARAFGEDRETVFVRGKKETATPETLKISTLKSFPVFEGNGDASYYAPDSYWRIPCIHQGKDEWEQQRSLVVVFCGKVYHGLHFITNNRYGGEQKEKFFWNYSSFKAWFDTTDGRMIARGWGGNNPERKCEEAFEVEPLIPIFLDTVIDRGISIAIKSDRSDAKVDDWFINTDGLKAIQFASAVDPYTAFQELSMFVGGVLPRPGNAMVELSGEKIMTQKHGFDKWSFRRHKDDVK